MVGYNRLRFDCLFEANEHFRLTQHTATISGFYYATGSKTGKHRAETSVKTIAVTTDESTCSLFSFLRRENSLILLKLNN